MKTSFLILGLIGCTLGVVRAENWPQFRGPTAQGISTEKKSPAQVERERERRVEDGFARRSVVVAHRLG